MFFDELKQFDADVFAACGRELSRQQHNIELIASENIVSKAVLLAAGTVLTNKYAEGYPGKRYYGGCVYVDEVEEIARERAKKLFGADDALHIEVLLPAFVLGMVIKREHKESKSDEWITTAISLMFMLLVGMSMPQISSSAHVTDGSIYIYFLEVLTCKVQ